MQHDKIEQGVRLAKIAFLTIHRRTLTCALRPPNRKSENLSGD